MGWFLLIVVVALALGAGGGGGYRGLTGDPVAPPPPRLKPRDR